MIRMILLCLPIIIFFFLEYNAAAVAYALFIAGFFFGLVFSMEVITSSLASPKTKRMKELAEHVALKVLKKKIRNSRS